MRLLGAIYAGATGVLGFIHFWNSAMQTIAVTSGAVVGIMSALPYIRTELERIRRRLRQRHERNR